MATKKENFIEVMSEFMNKNDFDTFIEEYNGRDEIMEFWTNFKMDKSNGKTTENGEKILRCMVEHEAEYENTFAAKTIAEILAIGSKTVSGAMRKLVTDGYVKKAGNNPVVYSLTAEGEQFS